MTDRDNLRQVIRDVHRMHCTHIRSESVREVFQGETVWDGVVEIFSCTDSPSMLVYGWSHDTDDGGRRYVTVLGKPPIKSARDAVRAHISADSQASTLAGGTN